MRLFLLALVAVAATIPAAAGVSVLSAGAVEEPNEIGFGWTTGIRSFEAKGVVLVAPLPQEVQNYTTYLAAVTTRAASRDQAQAFIDYLTSAPARDVFAATGAQ